MANEKLSPRQRRFVGEYLIDLNATNAAKRAGYSSKTASQIGFQLLRNLQVAAAIERAQKELEERTEITQEKVLRELARIAFADVTDYAGISEVGDLRRLSHDQTAAISEISIENGRVKCRLHDKLIALKLIGQHLGMFADRLELTGRDGGPIIVRYPTKSDDEESWTMQFRDHHHLHHPPRVPGPPTN